MKKALLIILTFLAINFGSINVVFASTKVESKLIVNTTEYIGGETVELTLKLNNLEDIKKGVNAYKATLDYDENVFEKVVESNFVCQNNWEEFNYNPKNKQFVLIKKVGTTAKEDIVKINLKVKENAKINKTVIKMTDITTSEGKKDIIVKDISIPINIIEKQISIPKDDTDIKEETDKTDSSSIKEVNKNVSNINTSNRNNNDKNQSANNKIEEDVKDDNEIKSDEEESVFNRKVEDTKNKKIRNTFLNYLWILLLILLITIVIFVVLYKKRNEKDKNRKTFMLFVLGLLLCELLSTTCVYAYNMALKGELNGDSVTNYADLKLLELHLIDLKTLPDDKLEVADMNSDGKLSVTDLSILIQKIENTLEYSVDISNVIADNSYPNKNGNITFDFSGNVSYGANINKLVINGQEYEVIKESLSSSNYSVTLNAGSASGVKTFKITEAKLDNNKTVKVNYEMKVDVLKEKPTISNYRVEEDINNSKLIILFDLIDKDDSLDSAILSVADTLETPNTLYKEKLKKGKNRIELNVDEKKEYKATIKLDYELDSNELSNDEDHSFTENIEKPLQLLIDYNLSLGNIKAYKDNVEAISFTKEDNIKIVFESTNNTNHVPKTAKIDGKEYEVQQEENKYFINLPSIKNIGENTITIDEIVLSNGKKIKLENNNSTVINVNKIKPSLSEFNTLENIESNTIKVIFSVNDEDKAISKFNIIVFDDNGNEIDRLVLERDDVRDDGTITKFLNTRVSSKYNVKVLIDYNLTEKSEDNIVEEIAIDEEITALARASIKSATPKEVYLEKKGNANITYEIESNRPQEITRILINSSECIATKVGNNIYEVIVPTTDVAGIYNLEATKVYYSDSAVANVSNITCVDILKDAPTIGNYSQIDNPKKSEITLKFDVIDNEDSFVSGKAILALDSKIVEKEIKKGSNEIIFNVIPLEKYTFTIKATYDLDSNSLENRPVEENVIVDESIDTRDIQLISDYNLTISNIKTYNENGLTKYFHKDETVKISFESSNSTPFEPVKVIVKGQERELTKIGNEYHFTFESHKDFGVKRAKIEKVILNNSKEEIVKENNEIAVAVLKDIPTVEDFSYKENRNASITLSFNVVDDENTISNAKLLITSESGKTIEKKITSGKNTYTFTPNENIYNVKVIADYDLDMNILEENANLYENITILNNDITLGERNFEMKDIISSIVYKQTSDGVVEASNIKINELNNLDNYIVKVAMKDMPTFYTTIKEAKVENNKLKFVLNYDNVVRYDENNKYNNLEIVYGEIKNNEVENVSLEKLIKEMEANPSGTFTLNRDYDATGLTSDGISFVSSSFSGTLNGNGHTIYNLSKPLFNELSSATIKNIMFKNVSLSASGSRGVIANIANNSIIKDIHISKLTYTTTSDRSGGIVGEATSTDIDNCSVDNLYMTTTHGRIGAIAGQLTGGNIRNCFTAGNVISIHKKDGSGISGILGTGEAAPLITIENCITNINYTSDTGHRLNGSIVGLALSANTKLINNLSLSTGEGLYAINGYTIHANSVNNYEIEGTTLTSNVDNKKVFSVKKEDINADFFINTMHFSEDIWNLKNKDFNNLPILKSNKNSLIKDDVATIPENSSLYIPEYDRVKTINGYSSNKDVTYHNLYKLMPYFDAKYLVEDANKVSDEALNTKIIRSIIPYSNGKMLTYMTPSNYNTITSVKVVFTDLTINNYNVEFKELNQNISIYKLAGTDLYYAPDNYVISSDANIVNTLKTYIEGIDYNTTLEPLTQATDARHYRDNFNEVIKGLSKEIALQLLANYNDDALTINSEILNNKIKADLIDSGKINEILYGYNYFNRWYGFEVNGTKVSDLLLFKSDMFKESNTLDKIVKEVKVGNIAVGATDGFYRTNVAKYTGSSTIQYFMDYIISNIGGYSDVNDWFTEYFGSRNFLAEFGVDDRPELLYRGWYQLKKNSRMILPVITMPSDSTYMISGPAHLQFGPAQLYNKDTVTAAGKNVVRNTINNHVTLAKRHFTVLAGSFGSLKWNNYCIMVYDCTKIITGYRQGYITIGGTKIPTGKVVPVYTQGRAGLNYAFFKNFSEVFGLWQPAGSSGGVGNTAGFLWFQAQPGLTNFDTWTHEFEHALSDKILLDQRGFRTRMEVMTQGNIEQRDDWSLNNLSQDVGPGYFNTSFYLDKEGNATQNLSPDRIDTKEEMENYFKGQQNALDLLDYIEGKAFIRLTPEQQAKIATKVVSGYEKTAWGTITADQATQMKLTSLESLYDNQIILRPLNAWGASIRGLTAPDSTIADNYGFESIWVNRWYIDHYDSHFSGAFGTKRNFFEMLGYAGVEGYIIYGSGSRSAIGDLNVIQRITKLVTGTEMNWREYKMSRYATVEDNLKNNKYIDAEYMIQRFTEALINDANRGDRNVSQRTNLRKIYYHYLKSATNDFIDDPLGSTVKAEHIKTAEELVKKINAKPYGYYVLDNDIDFSNMTTNVTKTFMGRLDGKGHKIIGNKFSIFNKIRYGYVGNIVFENTNIPKTNTSNGVLSVRAEMSTVEKINVKNLQMNFAGKNDLSLIGGAVSNVITRDCNVEKLTHHISNVEDIMMLNEDTSGIFVIDNDIDFTGKKYNGSVVTNIFTGKIEGNGHTISNLTNASLFADFRGTVENLNINNFSNTVGGDFVTAFAKQTYNSTVRKVKFNNITLSGQNNVAVLTGMDGRENANSTFENISVKNANVKGTGVYVSPFVGRKFGGIVRNIFVEGTLEITKTECGGIIGASQQNPIIENIVSNVEIKRPSNGDSRNQNGGFIGNIYNSPIIKNIISLGNVTGFKDNNGNEINTYKFTGATDAIINSVCTNCYEVKEATGISKVTANSNGHLNEIERKELQNKAFFKDTLRFDESIWNFSTISTKGYPELK